MLQNKTLRYSLFTTLLLSTSAQATSFNSFDPKSMAMGGAGVAIADPATAPFFNPALLSIAEKDDDFAIEIPVLGGRISDQNDFIDKIDGTDILFDNVDNAINAFNAQATFLPGSTQAMTSSMNTLNNRISSLNNSPLAGNGGLGMVVSIPSETFGLAFSASGSISGAGAFDYADAATVTAFTNDMTTVDNCIITNGGTINAGAIGCMQAGVTQVTIDGTTGDITFNTDTDLNSKAQFVGIGVTEVGLSISREFFIGSSNYAFGITPKSVSVSIIDFEASANTVEDDIDNITDNTDDFTDFNLDFGVARDFENGWRGGLAIKNLISQEYVSTGPLKTTVKLEPQIRAGVSHQNDWSTVAIDLDITENDTLGLLNGGSTQYASFGIEFNAWEIAQLRAGYRADLVNDNRDVFSVGFGLSPFGVHMDLGLAIGENENEAGFALQFGFRI